MENTIKNLFYGLDNSTREKKLNNVITTPALSQGSKFKNYQTKKKNYFNEQEGFQTSNVLAQQSKQILSDTKATKKDMTLQNKYNSVLAEYQKKLAEVSSGTTDFLDRLNPQKNPYLNKNVQFTTGHVCYVTNQGVVKWIPSGEIWDSLRNSPGKTYISLSIPWLDEYYTEGTLINTSPTMVSGTNMVLGETCGNAGSNVYVDKMITNTTTNYNGCYASNSMKFIGGSPPVDDSSALAIRNNNFKHPQIANNTYKYFSWSLSNVPGWNFNCVLLNNSSAWGYPMPYPNGNQCASIQKTQELWTANWLSFASGVTYTITFDACGRNCCDGSGLANPINVGLEYNTFYSFTPPVNKWTKYSTTFTVDSQQSMRISFVGTWTAGDRSSAIQNVVVTKGSSNNNLGGTYTYDMCKQAAIDGGYKFFGLQNVNTETSMGYCGVSNDPVGVVQKGTALAVSSGVVLWDTKTNGSGTSASLTTQGSLTVYNSSSTSVFNTDNSGAQPSGYIGCYLDKSVRAMAVLKGTNMDYATCKQSATDTGNSFFGLQNSTSGKNAECWFPNYQNDTRMYGKASNCTKIEDGTYSGGGWSNAIYSMDNTSIYYLILQDDGNMCIYRGSGPDDDQGSIWCSYTNGKQQKPNPDYTAAKGKYGKNWVPSGTTFAAGDFIGSLDGSIYLIMQADGNLVLYTSTDTENCQKMKDGNTGGGTGANALYEVSEVGLPSNLGKIGYVDSNSLLSTYPDSNIEQTENGPPRIKNLPIGVSDKMVNIDTLAFEHYPKTDKMKDAYGLSGANSVQKQQLGQLQTQLDLISQQLISETGNLNDTQIKLNNQSTANTKGLAGYLKDYKVTSAQVKNNSGTNMNHIVSDSDINVLKENYNYLFWSIVAVGTVLVSMNIVKK